MPIAFTLGVKVIANPDVAIFCAFGSIALLLLVDFRGPMGDRLRAQALLALAGAVLVCLGTLASRYEALAAIAMAFVGAVVLFAGVISSTLASASLPMLLAFILPVSLGGPVAVIPDRIAGWGIAAGLSLLAIRFLWPTPVQMPLGPATITALRALAARLRADVGEGGDAAPAPDEARAAVVEQADAAVATLGRVFNASPYRPTGLSTASRTLVRLVDELRWLGEILAQTTPPAKCEVGASQLRRLDSAAAAILLRCADLLAGTERSPAALQDAVAELRRAMEELEEEVTRLVPRLDGSSALRGSPSRGPSPSRGQADEDPLAGTLSRGQEELRDFQSRLDPSFRGQELGFVTSQIAANLESALAAEQRSWLDRLAGRSPDGADGPLASALARARSHLNRHSVWLHNSLRGGVALGLAVLVGELLKLEHSFWVVLGVLAVLRSNAVSTGQNTASALLGTLVGFVVGSSLVQLIGANETVLWLLLPLAVLLAGFLPVLSFAAGQAAFTFTLLILFNIFAPAGWHIGLVRVEDVAIGGATSVLVGLLFWPRGAASTFMGALADAYSQAAGYLTAAVAFATSCCDGGAPPHGPPDNQAARAARAARRLDDAFRSFVAEQGMKRLPLAQATALVNGPSGLRLAAEGILELWHGVSTADDGRVDATRELMSRADAIDGWYRGFAAALDGERPLPEASTAPQWSDGRLLRTIEHDLSDGAESASATAVRIVWTGDHLDAARRLESGLATAARAARPGGPSRVGSREH
jgi:hypothetical protein